MNVGKCSLKICFVAQALNLAKLLFCNAPMDLHEFANFTITRYYGKRNSLRTTFQLYDRLVK